MNKYKKYIPNLLTLFRIISTPFIIILGLMGYIKAVIVISIICSITDLFDGKLARKWNVVSTYGAKLDALSDKVFAIGLTACLIGKIHLLIIVLILEILIGLLNLYYFYKSKTIESLMIGKIKTTFLFTTIICCMLSIFYTDIKFLSYGFLYSTINLQLLCLIFYYLRYYKIIDKSSPVKETNKKENVSLIEETDKTIEVSNLIELAEKYNLYDNDSKL